MKKGPNQSRENELTSKHGQGRLCNNNKRVQDKSQARSSESSSKITVTEPPVSLNNGASLVKSMWGKRLSDSDDHHVFVTFERSRIGVHVIIRPTVLTQISLWQNYRQLGQEYPPMEQYQRLCCLDKQHLNFFDAVVELFCVGSGFGPNFRMKLDYNYF